MVPFTSSKPGGHVYQMNHMESVLDSYSGSGSQYIRKTDQAPLFNPQDNVQWTYGTPNVTDFIQSRQVNSMKNNMVKPFESIHVGPGLDKGYTTEGNYGFNSGMDVRDKWMPKNVDQLRVATNPKMEYNLDGLEGPANTFIKNIGIEGRMEKNRPDTYFESGQERWFTTTGLEKGPQLIPDHIIRPSVRNETTQFQQGTPNSTMKTAGYVPTAHETSKRIQLNAPLIGSSVATGSAPLQSMNAEARMKSVSNYNNNRSMNPQAQTFGSGFTSAIGAVVAPIMDILKPSRKEEYSGNVRVFGNLAGEVPGSYVQTPGDAPAHTIRESTMYEPRGYINNQKDNAGYLVKEVQPISNQRDTTNASRLMGASSKTANRVYDAEYRQTNNELKEKALAGRINPGNAKQFNPQMNIFVAKQDVDRENNRMWAPQLMLSGGPSMQTIGYQNVGGNKEVHDNTSRMDPQLLSALKSNPYAFSVHSIA